MNECNVSNIIIGRYSDNKKATHLGSPITVSQMKCNAENIQIDADVQIFP